uniref:ORM1-like protein n=1 Tax=Lygus hesperus TaxID=30085 RepID=A0A0A9W339_LYGHE
MGTDQQVVRELTEERRNVEFLTYKEFWIFYTLTVMTVRYAILLLLYMVSSSWSHYSFTVTVAIHTAVTIYAMHWVKGNPFSTISDQGVEKLTFWEQIDDGKQNTQNRKLLTLIPVVLGFAACVEARWGMRVTILNSVLTFLSILGKFPFMHRTRILGINSD